MKNQSQQAGFVSIIVCMIIMTILSLITIGFAQIMGREQRQALDRQLSTQAFYAAESGVNDAITNIGAFSPNSCSAPYPISGDGSVENTCVTANPVVPDIRFDQITPDQNNPKVFPIITTPAAPSTISIAWRPTTSSLPQNFRPVGNTSLPSQASWASNTGALKIYLVPFTNNQARDSLISAMGSIVLIPNGGPVSSPTVTYANFSGANFSPVQSVGCDSSTNTCTAYLSGIPAATNLYFVVTSLYQPNSVVIDARDSANGSLNFTNVQAVIDSTGKTTDVVRRIQVRQSLVDGYTVPAGALEATDPVGSICKLIQASPTGTSAGAGCSF